MGNEAKPVTEEESRNMEEAQLQAIDTEQLAALDLPNTCSSGHGHCGNGMCYVCCNGTWYRLVNQNDQQYTCQQGRGMFYNCGGNRYAATC